jgi:DNA-binding transcriptional MerR regulator
MPSMTLKGIAQQLQRPESTVRHWRDQFSAYIPTEGQGRARRYPAEAVVVFELIATSFAQGLGSADVGKRLAEHYGESTEAERDEHNANASTTPQVVEQGRKELAVAFQSIAVTMERLADQEEELRELRKANAERNEELKELYRRVATLESKQTAEEKRRDLVTRVKRVLRLDK